MSGYSYCNGVYNVRTSIRPNFKRFHSMNAQYRVFDLDERFKCYQFVSYATNIMQVICDRKHDSWSVSFNDDPFSYSRSTSRQVSRFIREMQFPFTSYDVRDALNGNLFGTPDVVANPVSSKVHITFRSNDAMARIWR